MEQLNFEIQYAKENISSPLDKLKPIFLKPCMADLLPRLEIDPDRVDQEEIANTWSKMDLEETMWKCLTTVFFGKSVTVQQLLGMFFHSLDHIKIGQRRAKVMEPFFLALSKSPYISFEKRGVEFFYDSNLKVDTTDYGYILPSLDIPFVDKNSNSGYQSIKEHVITGGRLKEHDEEVCLDHINRLNGICYRIETRLQYLYKPKFKGTPKIKSNGSLESPLDIQKRFQSFTYYTESLPDRIRVMVQQGNKFHFCHRYDTRLRTYVKAFHFDYVGQKYSRAIVQPYNSELVEGTDEYF